MNPITPVITINITSFQSAKLSREDKDNKKCNKNWGCFWSQFSGKTMGYSLGIFS